MRPGLTGMEYLWMVNQMRKHLVLGMVLLLLSGSPALGEGPQIGTVKGTKGLVSILRGGATLPAPTYTKVLQSDTIMTGSDGAIGILLEDNTLLALGPMSRLALDKFKFVPAKNEYAMQVRMEQGTFVYISGLLGKLAPHAVQLETPVGTVSMLKESSFMARFPEEAAPKP